ncbi:MAG: hypothetical protein H6R00_4401 [Proteobacteria bacterium]|nr:hypothetical protein [Pseudomonadota bacterium]
MKQRMPMNSTTPCGSAKAGPEVSPPKVRKCGAAQASSAAVKTTAISDTVTGVAPRLSRPAQPAAPAMPPTLNRPWKPLISALPAARSTITA